MRSWIQIDLRRLRINWTYDEDAYEVLDLVATAIAADIVPMTGENRILLLWFKKSQ